jgi:lipooligosaccharide transport system permease protein
MSTPAAIRVWEGHLAVYRRIWRGHALGAFVQPMLFLLGMGVGVGGLVDRGNGGDVLGGVSYFSFLAPALLATTAMFSTANEGLWPVMDGFTWSQSYRSMTTTPLRPLDVVNGVAVWHATRAAIGVAGVAAVLACFDETRSWGLIAAIPCGVVTGLAFSLPFAAWSATRVSDQSFPAIMRFVVTPMFLFAGAFYPLEQLPGWLHPVAYATPLWHGVEVARKLTLNTLGIGAFAVHIAVQAAYVFAGWAACRITYRRRLAQ